MNNVKQTIFILFVSLLMTFSAESQDKANLNYYKEANSKIDLTKSGENRVVFMGNSITEFWSTNHPAFFSENPYINRGISGQTTTLMLMRFDADVVQLKPGVVVFLGGTNDIAQNSGPITIEQIIANIGAMAQMAKTAGIKVVLCSVLPVYQYYWRPDIQPIEQINSLNNLIKTYTEANGMMYADFYSALVNEEKGLKKEFTWDGVHPNLEGYLVMEPIVQEAIRKAVADTLTNALPEIPAGVENFDVFPNPLTQGSLTVKLPDGKATIFVTDATGKEIFQKEVIQNTFSINESVFQQNGIYIISVFNSGKIFSKKIVFSK